MTRLQCSLGMTRLTKVALPWFKTASGIAVYIGPTRQQTKALHQLESPKEVEQVLALLAETDP